LTRILSLLLVFLVAQACQRSATTNPKAPKAAYPVTKMEVQNDKFLSTVNIPVSIALTDVERQINSQVNGLIYEDNSLTDNDDDQFMTKVWKRAPIQVTAQDSLFYFVIPLKIWAKAGMQVLGFSKYQETEFELNLKFATRFSIDKDWTANTQTTAEGYDWVKKPAVKIAGFEIPVTSIVGRLIDKNLGKITKALDEQVRKIPYLVVGRSQADSDHAVSFRKRSHSLHHRHRRVYVNPNRDQTGCQTRCYYSGINRLKGNTRPVSHRITE
jgi:hypothetical protein